MTPETQPCEFCYMNPPWEATEDGELKFLPVPDALPGDVLCAECRRQANEWSQSWKTHNEESHQAPWKHDCLCCSMEAYAEEKERNWQAHLAQCEACQNDDVKGHVREGHRDLL